MITIGNVFVDTNVLVYARDSSEPRKQPRAAEWLALLWETRRGRLSVQVLHEYYVTVTRKLRPGMSFEDARDDVLAFRGWSPISLGAGLTEAAWAEEQRYGFSFWDALIVAAARRSASGWLLSEDMQEGQNLDGLTVVNPFRTAPAEILRI